MTLTELSMLTPGPAPAVTLAFETTFAWLALLAAVVLALAAALLPTWRARRAGAAQARRRSRPRPVARVRPVRLAR